jgi:hypothetical protein
MNHTPKSIVKKNSAEINKHFEWGHVYWLLENWDF